MNITNERGVQVSVGAMYHSATWIKAKYPDQVEDQVRSVLLQQAEKKQNVVIEFVGDFKDHLAFHQAVMYYALRD